jgi:predicted phosphoribosyltransferase
LAEKLSRLDLECPLVLALPRGGVPVAAPVAETLCAPLEVFVVRKVGAPGQEELGIGAVAEGLDPPMFTSSHWISEHSPAEVEALALRARKELERRVTQYRGDRPLPDMAGRDVILVDDGLATGVTAEAALVALRRARPHRLVLAVPVCAAETAERLSGLADEVVCAETPPQFYAVGQWYDDFSQTTDDEVLELLARFRSGSAPDRRSDQ